MYRHLFYAACTFCENQLSLRHLVSVLVLDMHIGTFYFANKALSKTEANYALFLQQSSEAFKRNLA